MREASAAKPKRLPRAVREQQMMDAAVAEFARRGYHAASMDEIADRAGISKPMLYLYLGSKEDLFLACIKREAARVRTAVTSAFEEDLAPDRQLWNGLRGFFTVVAEHRDAWRVLHQQAPAHGDPFAGEVAALRTSIVDFVAALIRRSVTERATPRRRRTSSEDLVALAHALVGSCEALADWAVSGTRAGEDPDVTAARLMNFAWLGLDNLLRGERWATPRTPRRALSRRPAR